MTPSISEILLKLNDLDTENKKIAWLKQNNSTSLRTIISIMLDHSLKWNIPTESPPPYKKSNFPDSQGMLYRQTRKLPYFFEGYAGNGLTEYRRQALFIELLESIDAGDSEFLVEYVLMRKPFVALSRDLATKALNMKFTEDPIKTQPTTQTIQKGRRKKVNGTEA